MSRTYDIACRQREKALRGGRKHDGRPGYLHLTPETMLALQSFLFDHEGHLLVFGKGQAVSESYEQALDRGGE